MVQVWLYLLAEEFIRELSQTLQNNEDAFCLTFSIDSVRGFRGLIHMNFCTCIINLFWKKQAWLEQANLQMPEGIGWYKQEET